MKGIIEMFEELLQKTPADYIPQISDYIKVLLPCIATYFVTRYTLSKPRKYEIKEKQFSLVYLPLYQLTKQLMKPELRNENKDIYLRKLHRIIHKNYQYVFPKTLKLLNEMEIELAKPNPNTYHISNFEIQLESDYEKLKHELGYPTNSIVDFFKRLSWFNKFLYIVLLAFGIGAGYAFIDSWLLFLSGDLLNAFSALFVGAILSAGIYIISYPMRH